MENIHNKPNLNNIKNVDDIDDIDDNNEIDDTNEIDVNDEKTILNNMKNMYDGENWSDVFEYYNKLSCGNRHHSHIYVCSIAACHGHLEIFKWAYNMEQLSDMNCSFLCVYAGNNGHLDILYYLYEIEAPYGGTGMIIHENCKEFFNIYGEYWKKGDFTYNNSYLKPAKNK